MALLNDYGEHNKIIEQGRVINYTVTPYRYNKNAISPVTLFWTIKRTSTMSYNYVGMDYDTAMRCADEVRQLLTRDYADYGAYLDETGDGLPAVYITQDYVYECRSKVNVNKSEGHMWSVSVSEEDEDQICTTEEITDATKFEELFQLAFQRERGGTNGGSIAILKKNWNSTYEEISASYNQVIPHYDKDLLSVQVLENDDWRTLQRFEVRNVTKDSVVFDADENKTFRLAYQNGIFSEKAKTSNPEVPKMTVLNAYCEDDYMPGTQFTMYKDSKKITMYIETEERLPIGLYSGSSQGSKSYALVVSQDGGENERNAVSLKIEQYKPNQYKIVGWYDVKGGTTIIGGSYATNLYAYFETSYRGYDNKTETVKVKDNVTVIGLKKIENGLTITPSCMYFEENAPFNWCWDDNGGSTILSAQTTLPPAYTYTNVRREYNATIGIPYHWDNETHGAGYNAGRFWGDSYANIQITSMLSSIHQVNDGDNIFLSGAEPYVESIKFGSYFKEFGERDYPITWGNCLNNLSVLKELNLGGIEELYGSNFKNTGHWDEGVKVYAGSLLSVWDLAFDGCNLQQLTADNLEFIQSEGFNGITYWGTTIYIRNKTMEQIQDIDGYPFGLAGGTIVCKDGILEV